MVLAVKIIMKLRSPLSHFPPTEEDNLFRIFPSLLLARSYLLRLIFGPFAIVYF